MYAALRIQQVLKLLSVGTAWACAQDPSVCRKPFIGRATHAQIIAAGGRQPQGFARNWRPEGSGRRISRCRIRCWRCTVCGLFAAGGLPRAPPDGRGGGHEAHRSWSRQRGARLTTWSATPMGLICSFRVMVVLCHASECGCFCDTRLFYL